MGVAKTPLINVIMRGSPDVMLSEQDALTTDEMSSKRAIVTGIVTMSVPKRAVLCGVPRLGGEITGHSCVGAAVLFVRGQQPCTLSRCHAFTAAYQISAGIWRSGSRHDMLYYRQLVHQLPRADSSMCYRAHISLHEKLSA